MFDIELKIKNYLKYEDDDEKIVFSNKKCWQFFTFSVGGDERLMTVFRHKRFIRHGGVACTSRSRVEILLSIDTQKVRQTCIGLEIIMIKTRVKTCFRPFKKLYIKIRNVS